MDPPRGSALVAGPFDQAALRFVAAGRDDDDSFGAEVARGVLDRRKQACSGAWPRIVRNEEIVDEPRRLRIVAKRRRESRLNEP